MEEEQKQDEQDNEEYHISPGTLGLIALLSIGGLLIVGWQSSSITGGLSTVPYYACCTVQPWGSSASGYRQGTGITTSEMCDPVELPNRCCVRAGRDRYNMPVNFVSSSFGMCAPQTSSPAMSYPSSVLGYKACCTVQSWRRSPTGFNQGVAETTTQDCDPGETIFQCCGRAGVYRMNLPVRVLGVKEGSCEVPEVSYPTGQASVRGYSTCCSYETWRQSPMGYSQSTAQTVNGYCDELETPSQCCIRTASMSSKYPVKMLGTRMGSCQQKTPERSYPIWIP